MFGSVAKLIRNVLGKTGNSVKKAYWYVSQNNDLSECGSACINMALRWSNSSADPVQAISGIWYNASIKKKLLSRGLNASYMNRNKITNITKDQAVIARIDTMAAFPHFVFVIQEKHGVFLVADPLSGSRLQRWEDFQAEVLAGNVIVISR